MIYFKFFQTRIKNSQLQTANANKVAESTILKKKIMYTFTKPPISISNLIFFGGRGLGTQSGWILLVYTRINFSKIIVRKENLPGSPQTFTFR